jgi:hypothetical protein
VDPSRLSERHGIGVPEKRMLRICGIKSQELTGGNRNEELHNFNSSPNIIMIIKSRRMSWTGHVAWMKAQKCVQSIGQKT